MKKETEGVWGRGEKTSKMSGGSVEAELGEAFLGGGSVGAELFWGYF